MKIGTVINIVNYELPTVEAWYEGITLTLDLLDGEVSPIERMTLTRIIELTQPRITYDELEELLMHKFDDVPIEIKDYLISLRMRLVNRIVVQRENVIYGGTRAYRHNLLIKVLKRKYGIQEKKGDEIVFKLPSIKFLIAKDPALEGKIKKEIIPEYINDAVYSKDKVIDGNIIPVFIPLFSFNDPNLDVNNQLSDVTMFDFLDDRMILHNKLVRNVDIEINALKKDTPDFDARYGAYRGIGLFPSWYYSEFPHHPNNERLGDGKIRRFVWKASRRLTSKDDKIEMETLKSIPGYFNARAGKKKDLIAISKSIRTGVQKTLKDLGFESIGKTQYFIPEIIVTQFENVGGKIQPLPEKLMNVVYRPNRRIVGLTQQEMEYNDAVKRGETKLNERFYFDSDKMANVAAFKKQVIEAKDGKLEITITYEIIPPHSMDVYDESLRLAERKHDAVLNKLEAMRRAGASAVDIETERRSGLPLLLKDVSGKPILHVVHDYYEDMIRSMMDTRYYMDWRFEEIILGPNLPFLDALEQYFIDQRTNEVSWRFADHVYQLIDLSKRMVVFQSNPANIQQLAHIIGILADSAVMSKQDLNFFQSHYRDYIEPHVEKIFSRLPALSKAILIDHMQISAKDSIMNLIDQLKNVDIYTEGNFDMLHSKLIDIDVIKKRYLNYIEKSYPFAVLTSMPEEGAFFSTSKDREHNNALLAFGVQIEPENLRRDRIFLETRIKFLEIAHDYLERDKQRPIIQRRYIKPGKRLTKQIQIIQAIPSIPDKNKEDIYSGLSVILSKEGMLVDFVDQNQVLRERWGHYDLLRGMGDPSIFFFDVITALLRYEKEAKAVEIYKILLDKLKKTVNIRNARSTRDCAFHYRINLNDAESKVLESVIASHFQKYYDDSSIIIKYENEGDEREIKIYRKITIMVTETIDSIYHDDLDMINLDFTTKKLEDLDWAQKLLQAKYRQKVDDLPSLIKACMESTIKTLETTERKEIKMRALSKDEVTDLIQKILGDESINENAIITYVSAISIDDERKTIVIVIKDTELDAELAKSVIGKIKELLADVSVLKIYQLDISGEIANITDRIVTP